MQDTLSRDIRKLEIRDAPDRIHTIATVIWEEIITDLETRQELGRGLYFMLDQDKKEMQEENIELIKDILEVAQEVSR